MYALLFVWSCFADSLLCELANSRFADLNKRMGEADMRATLELMASKWYYK